MSGGKGFHHTGGYGRYKSSKSKPSVGDRGREILEQLDDNNVVIQMFREYAIKIDDRHDRHERIVKISRDITIESKRIIFLLHSIATILDSKREQIYSEAEHRLTQLIDNKFRLIAVELENHDSYLYLRAYTAGLQEFVEALLYYQYLKYGFIKPCQDLCKKFLYTICDEMPTSTDEDSTDSTTREVSMMIPMPEFFYGLLDFTGELMRRCINNLGSGNIDDCFKICNYVKDIYTGFLGLNYSGVCKEMGRKVYVLKTSLLKMEYACYTIQVRGSEIPKDLLAAVVSANTTTNMETDQDEGYY